MGAISFFGALLSTFQMVVELVNFGAFLGFVLVNLSVIGHYYVRSGERSGVASFRNLLFPLAGAVACGYVWMNLGVSAKLLGFAWTLVGITYLAVLTHGFRTQVRDLEIS